MAARPNGAIYNGMFTTFARAWDPHAAERWMQRMVADGFVYQAP